MANEPTNLQSAIDMLQNPADVGSISPIGINDKFTPELSRDPVLRKLQQFFRIAKNEVNNPLNYLAGAGAIGKVDKVKDLISLKKKGFDVDNPLYHGSKEVFETFDPSMIGKRDKGFYGKGFYFTPIKKEAEVYGPNVGEYYVKGKILNLGGSSELGRVFNPNSINIAEDVFDDYRKWAKELNKIDALPPIQKNAYQDFLKAEKYFNKNLKMIPTGKIKGGMGDGQTIYKGQIKDPYYDSPIEVDDILDKNEIKEVFFSEVSRNHPSFPFLKKMEPRLSNVVRDLDDLEYNEGIDDVADFISNKAKKAGYSGINAGSETVIFNSDNIVSSNILKKQNPKIDSLQKQLDKLQKAEKLEFDPGSAEDIAEAAKIRQSIPYGSSDEIAKELLDLQGTEKLDLNLLARLRKELNI